MADTTRWLPLFEKFITLLRIDSKEVAATDSRGAKLDLWGSQRMFLEQIAEGLERGVRTFFCLKSRQLGCTTISIAIDLFWLAMHPGTIGCLVCDNDANRDVFRSTLRRYIESFPKGFFGQSFAIVPGGDNRNFMKFSNGSRLDFIVAGKTKKNWGEGRGYSYVHATECASYGKEEGISSFRETLADTHPNRLFIFESTAKGPNMWKAMYEEGLRDTLTKKSFFIGWWAKEINSIRKKDPRFEIYGVAGPDPAERELIALVKERHGVDVSMESLAWYRWRAADESTTLQNLHQNQPWYDGQAFVLSGFSFFQVRQLQKELKRITEGENDEGGVPFRGYKMVLGNDFWASVMEPIGTTDRLGEVELRIWQDPDKEGVYAIGCDGAFGRSETSDNSCVSVWRCFAEKMVQVAEYASNKYETHQTAWVLAYLAGIYENCTLNVELTGGAGRAILREFDSLRERLRSEMYEKVVSDRGWQDFLWNARHYLYKKSDSFSGGSVKSFDTNGRSKWEIMNQLRDTHSTNSAVINSAPLIYEMLDVVQEGYEIAAQGHNKDDRVFAWALANRVWIDDLRMLMTAQGLTYGAWLQKDDSDSPRSNAMINAIVGNFFKTAEERAQETVLSPKDQWMSDRGFV